MNDHLSWLKEKVFRRAKETFRRVFLLTSTLIFAHKSRMYFVTFDKLVNIRDCFSKVWQKIFLPKCNYPSMLNFVETREKYFHHLAIFLQKILLRNSLKKANISQHFCMWPFSLHYFGLEFTLSASIKVAFFYIANSRNVFIIDTNFKTDFVFHYYFCMDTGCSTRQISIRPNFTFNLKTYYPILNTLSKF